MDSSSTYLFRGMGEGQMKKILAAGKESNVKKGQQIIKEGQAANGIYQIRKGQRWGARQWRHLAHSGRLHPRCEVTPSKQGGRAQDKTVTGLFLDFCLCRVTMSYYGNTDNQTTGRTKG